MNEMLTKRDQMRAGVLELFEDARRARGALYVPDRFLAYLTEPPASTGRRVADTFPGRRRFVRFMESVQLAFGVCFTTDEWDRGYGLDEFVALVAAKAGKPGVARRLAEQRVREARRARVSDPVRFGLFAVPLLVGAVSLSHPVVRVTLLVMWIVIVGGITLVTARAHRAAAKLVERITPEGG